MKEKNNVEKSKNINENEIEKSEKVNKNIKQKPKMNQNQKKKIDQNQNKSQKRKMKTWKKVLLIILIAAIAYGIWFAYKTHKNGGGLSGMLATVVGHDENTKKNLPEFKVLLLGVSTDLGDSAPTDTIMVASYNPNTQKATLLSIPRDTFVGSNKNKATPSDKINSLYSTSIDKILEAVNNITGLDIQYYAVVKTEAFIELVDAIDGVTFNVPIDMNYKDPTQNLVIDLKAGEQVLDGDKAEQLLRFRHNTDGSSYPMEYGDNDTGRMRTQREFIMAVMQQTLKPENVFKIGEILDIASKNLETNLDFNYLKDYIPYAVEFSTENMSTDTLPGVNDQLPPVSTGVKNRFWFFIPNETETETLIQKLFYPETLETTEEGTNTINGTGNETNITSTQKTKEDVTIEVLNGSGSNAKLQEAVDLLKQNGYNVTKTGQTSEISKTIITNKKELEDEMLKDIQKILGKGSIGNNKNLSSKVDATIVIGKDFNQN